MGGGGAAERLWDEFRGVYEAAGSPTLASLVAVGGQQRPPARVSDSTLSEWLTRQSVPSSRNARVFLALMVVLQGQARTRSGYQPRPEGWWQQLLRQAQEERATGQKSGRPRRLDVQAPGSHAHPGWLLDEITDPFAQEVHQPVRLEGQELGLPDLPPYIPRDHDHQLAERAGTALAGRSTLAVLVGGSSTGKTRACWEMLDLLRGQVPGWRLWHPIDPSRPEAALHDLPHIGPRTVVWLNEAQEYLGAPAGLGERVAAGLRELLRTSAREPVLIVATLWPKYWDALTARPAEGPDPHAQARELLSEHDIEVPEAFTPAEMGQLRDAGDPRLAAAAAGAEDRQVTQFLAGVPELLARYRNASAPAKALIHAAMDALRLGMRRPIPHAFLEAAAPGYLTAQEWDDEGGEDWLDRALGYTAVPCKGTRGPLTRIRPRPDAPTAETGAGPVYRLADYLDQLGRRTRSDLIPPPSFWAAAPGHARPGDLVDLADAARDRGLYRDAARLYKHATACGDKEAAVSLIEFMRRVDPAGQVPVGWIAAHVFVCVDKPGDVDALWQALGEARAQEFSAALIARAAGHASFDDANAIEEVLNLLAGTGAHERASALAARAAAHASLDDTDAVAALLRVLVQAGAQDQADVLVARAIAHVSLGNALAVARLLRALAEVGVQDQADVLIGRAAGHVSLEDAGGVAALLQALAETGKQEETAALIARDPAGHVSLDDAGGVAALLQALAETGKQEETAALIARDPAGRVSLNDAGDIASLLPVLAEVGADDQVGLLAARAAAHVSLENLLTAGWLLRKLTETGLQDQAGVLAARAAAHVSLDDAGDIAPLLRVLGAVGAHDQVGVLAARAAGHVALDDAGDIASLLPVLAEVGADDQVGVLAARAAAHVSLDDVRGVARLLEVLAAPPPPPASVAVLPPVRRGVGADDQVGVLAARAAAHVSLGNPFAVMLLLRELAEVGAHEQVSVLAARAAGHVALANAGAITELLRVLAEVGAHEQVGVLAARAAGHVALANAGAITELLRVLAEVEAHERVGVLAARAARHIPLGSWWSSLPSNPIFVTGLLDVLTELRAQEDVDVLIARLPGAGLFGLWMRQGGHEMWYPFGREPDGSPAAPWGWDELADVI